MSEIAVVEQKDQTPAPESKEKEAIQAPTGHLATAASTVEKEDMAANMELDDDEEKAVEELRARRNQLQGMVDD